MNFDKKNARFLSMLGHRGAFSVSITELAQTIDNLILLTADLATLTGLERFRKIYPDKFYNIGIAEQNMIGVAGGLAKDGNVVFATTYANFITMRSYEQIRMNLGYMQFNVKLIGTGGGLSMGLSGSSHLGIEDVALMRAIPNMTIISPADGNEIAKTIFAAGKHVGPMYIRLTGGMNSPIVYNKDYEFVIGKAITLREGNDIAIVSTGTMVYESLEAAKELEKQGLSAQVINMHTIKPLDTDIIDRVLKRVKLLVTVEEHSVIGGLASAIAEYKSQIQTLVPQLSIGLPDQFVKPGEYSYLMSKYGLTSEKISRKIVERYSSI
ncbi:transketolase family protein [Clostridium beijerinckii]|uniref:Transketolase n=1 Tax=Clostridium beijerinckii TaxID=1520 RepID=A0A7X9SJX9_CLOBE|nr:transketolase C-terminal domain-containing protein [Clostridium beijerinckii]NMF03277.1 transketolase [Clostridium beijerinckii]